MKVEKVKLVYISNDLAQQTAAFLASFATFRPSEGVVYWFGIEGEESIIVTTLVVPDADVTCGSIRTTPQANAAAIGVIINTPLVYIGQAHSHPGRDVSHSCVDDEETFAQFDGAISVVVPWFGRFGLDLETIGVYRHQHGRFGRAHCPQEHLRILPGATDLRRPARESKGDRDVVR